MEGCRKRNKHHKPLFTHRRHLFLRMWCYSKGLPEKTVPQVGTGPMRIRHTGSKPGDAPNLDQPSCHWLTDPQSWIQILWGMFVTHYDANSWLIQTLLLTVLIGQFPASLTIQGLSLLHLVIPSTRWNVVLVCILEPGHRPVQVPAISKGRMHGEAQRQCLKATTWKWSASLIFVWQWWREGWEM